ncbi:MAG: APC family permease [Puniceicoccales bacterium]|jgi:amino acid transporter|nr:APC family permease [Puniceicoccales bacterium]
MKALPPSRPKISIFTLAMINFAAIASMRSLPSVAPYGFSLLFFYTLAAFLFLIPTALVSAELTTLFPEGGGIYTWVSHALGERAGFFAVFLQNVNNFVCFPMALSFVAGTIAYGIFPSLEQSRLFTLAVILIMIWGGTIVALRGIRVTGSVSAIGSSVGTFLPISMMVGLCIYWLLSGHPSQISFSGKTFFPDLSSPNNVSLTLGLLLSFAGMEMSANHINDVENPRKNYPRAIFLATLLILFVSIFGSLAIAIVVPREELVIHAGATQALARFFAELNVSWLTPIVAILETFGAVAWFCTWVSGPPRALHATVRCGHLPQIFHGLNRHGMPTNIMLAQAIISTALALIFIFAESISTAFIILADLTAQYLLLMYVLMFLAAIILKIRRWGTLRTFRTTPGGEIGTIFLSALGLGASLVSYVIGFFPPSGIGIQSPRMYTACIIVGNVVALLLPYLLSNRKKNSPQGHRVP